jgi:hypothetical protein
MAPGQFAPGGARRQAEGLWGGVRTLRRVRRLVDRPAYLDQMARSGARLRETPYGWPTLPGTALG